MSHNSKILDYLASNLTNLNNFHPLEAVDRASGTQLQEVETKNRSDQRVEKTLTVPETTRDHVIFEHFS